MSVSRENFVIIIVAVVAVVLQLVLSPYIEIANCAPNIIAAYVLVVAVVRSTSHRVVVLAFILGLCYNLFQGGPVGAMALVLTAVAYIVGRGQALLNNDTSFMPILLAVIGLLLTEVCYAIALVITGSQIDLFQAVAMRALPCTLYDAVIAFIWYFFMSRSAAEPSTDVPPIGGPTLLR